MKKESVSSETSKMHMCLEEHLQMFFEQIYGLMHGDIDLDNYNSPLKDIVENQFDEDKECGKILNVYIQDEIDEINKHLTHRYSGKNKHLINIQNHYDRLMKLLSYESFVHGITVGIEIERLFCPLIDKTDNNAQKLYKQKIQELFMSDDDA